MHPTILCFPRPRLDRIRRQRFFGSFGFEEESDVFSPRDHIVAHGKPEPLTSEHLLYLVGVMEVVLSLRIPAVGWKPAEINDLR
jgi:hypothetical protein